MSTTTPNMGLTKPDVSTGPGPEWAQLVNNSLDVVDSHDHSVDKGNAITPAGINIDQDLAFGDNNITGLKQAQMTNNVSDPTGAFVRCIFPLNGELYYKDSNSNLVQITDSGGVVGAPGNIGGIVGSAAITYTSIGKNRFIFVDEFAATASIEVEDVDAAGTVTADAVNAESGRGILPLGAIVPVAANIAGSIGIPAPGTVDSNGFMVCDGSAIPGGQSLSGNVPDLSDNRFLMGASTAGTTGGNTTINFAHTHTVNSHSHNQGTLYALGATYISGSTSRFGYIPSGQNVVGAAQYISGTGSGTQSINETGAFDGIDVQGDTGSSSPGTSSSLSSTDIRPQYLSTIYLIRVS